VRGLHRRAEGSCGEVMQLHQQFNMTPFRTGIGFCQDGEGRDLVVGLLKATFHFAANGPIAAAARDVSVPIFKKDVFHGEPASSSLRYSTDLVPSKPGVDNRRGRARLRPGIEERRGRFCGRGLREGAAGLGSALLGRRSG